MLRCNLKYILLLILFLFILLIAPGVIENFHIINNDNNLEEINYKKDNLTPLVVLYNGLNRHWNETVDNHIEVIKKITNNNLNNTIIGIHYWKKDQNLDTDIPESIKNTKHLVTTTDDVFGYNFENYFDKGVIIIKKFINSIAVSLKNAEQLYFLEYGKEMPMNQSILRFRYDGFINDIDAFPLPLIDEDNYYLSIWNTNHRKFNKDKLEIADVCFLTTKKALVNLINVDVDEFLKQQDFRKEADFHESILYSILKYAQIKIVFDYNLKLSVMRENKNIDIMSK